MSGFLRNMMVFLWGLWRYGRQGVGDTTEVRFSVTPFDAGWRRLKSDKYLQFAEAAQVDYLMKTGRFFAVLRAGTAFVNVAQLIRFYRPASTWSRLRVETRLVYADDKCAYFQHQMHTAGGLAAEALVKMKFKKGRLTVPPSVLLPGVYPHVPAAVTAMEGALCVEG